MLKFEIDYCRRDILPNITKAWLIVVCHQRKQSTKIRNNAQTVVKGSQKYTVVKGQQSNILNETCYSVIW